MNPFRPSREEEIREIIRIGIENGEPISRERAEEIVDAADHADELRAEYQKTIDKSAPNN